MSVLLETKELDSLLTMSSMCLGAQLAVSRILKNLFKVIGSLYKQSDWSLYLEQTELLDLFVYRG